MINPGRVAILLAVAALCLSAFPQLDIQVAEQFYCQGETDRWCHKNTQPWDLLYRFGAFPSVAVGITGLFLAIAAARKRGRQMQVGLFLSLSLIIGPGLLVNNVFKPLCARPRPRQITTFGGKEQFRTPFEPEPGTKGRSLPSGHVATAFFFGALSLLPRSRIRSTVLLVCSFALGGLMTVARIAQGAHFLSDAAWAAFITWATIAAVARFTIKKPGRPSSAFRS